MKEPGGADNNQGHIMELSRILVFIVILLLPFPIFASGAGPEPETVVTKANNGKEITVSAGAVFELRLQRAGATGYLWEIVDPDETHLKVLSSADTPLKQGLIGGPSLKTWRIKAVKAGETDLKALLYRPWEGTEKAAEGFRVHIRIR